MKIRVLTDTHVNGKYEKAGTICEVTDGAGSRLVMLGWAEAVVEEVKAPKKTAKKK